MNDLFAQAQELFEFSRQTRRDLHMHPELGYREVRTAGIVARELASLGMEVTTGVAETGVIGLLEGSQPGPVALVRFDMDALPIEEDTGAEYASQTPGIMHACGHDGHVAVGLTVARMLAARKSNLHGAVKFVFQPAEEGLGGAERMIEAGVLESPAVDVTLSLHVWNERPVGWVGLVPGPLMAGADVFDVTIEGKGGHGALPHTTVDPLIAAAQIVSALQTVVSRNVPPLETAVVSVCRLKAGEAFNVIPQRAEFAGTFRTFNPDVRKIVVERFAALVQGMAEALGCQADVKIRRLTPAVINDPAVTERLTRAALVTLPDMLLDTTFRTMVSEDMAFMMEKVPGCYMMVGSANASQGKVYGHHHPKFDIDEAVLPRAAALMAAAALEMLKGKE